MKLPLRVRITKLVANERDLEVTFTIPAKELDIFSPGRAMQVELREYMMEEE